MSVANNTGDNNSVADNNAGLFNDLAFLSETSEEDIGTSVSPQNLFNKAINEERARVESQSNPSPNESNKKITSLEKRLEDSGTEAKRLNSQLETLKPFIPMIEAMQKNPDFFQHVQNFGEKSEPKSIQEELNLPEDFIFDSDEAMRDPESISAKVFNAQVKKQAQKLVDSNLDDRDRKQESIERDQNLAQEKADLKKEFNLTDNDIAKIDDWANNNTLTYKMLFQIMNLGNRDRNVIKDYNKSKVNQRERMLQVPNTASGTSSSAQAMSDDDLVFEAIKKVKNPVANIFKQTR